jgi:hypothetical protein
LLDLPPLSFAGRSCLNMSNRSVRATVTAMTVSGNARIEQQDAVNLMAGVSCLSLSFFFCQRCLRFFRLGGRYDPASVVVGLGLLEDLVLRMKHMSSFAIVDPAFYRLLSPEFLALDPFPRVRDLCFLFQSVGSAPRPEEFAILGQISSLPALDYVALNLFNELAEFPHSLALSSSTYVPPHHIHVPNVQIRGQALGDGVGLIFSSLGQGCQFLKVEADRLTPSFFRASALLPSSLTFLEIEEGHSCDHGGDAPVFAPIRDRLGSAFDHLVNLDHLVLQGDILSREGFDALASHPQLHILSLGSHINLSATHLLAYLDPDDPRYIPHLHHLSLSVCLCGVAKTQNYFKVHWPPSFSLQDGERLLDKARSQGLDVTGTLASAVVMAPRQTPRNEQLGRKMLKKGR